jgi:3-oxoacyl-[acyl-carrier-protein] synthase I
VSAAGQDRATVLGLGLCTPLGLTAETTVAEMAAGTLRFADTEVVDGCGEPVRASRLSLLEPEHSRSYRMGALAKAALAQALETLFEQGIKEAPLFLGLPSAEVGADVDEESITRALIKAAAPDVRLTISRTFRSGRAACLQALAAAQSELHAPSGPSVVIVGAVDSLCDPASLAYLVRENRILGGTNRDGLIAGEGAGFLVLSRPESAHARRAAPLGTISKCALATERIPFTSREPSLSAGLTEAFRKLRQGGPRVDMVLSCQTGESFWAHELARAHIRNSALMPEPLAIALIAESLGDVGAASGAIQLGAAVHPERGLVGAGQDAPPASVLSRRAPRRALVYACSDDGAIGACVVDGHSTQVLPS